MRLPVALRVALPVALAAATGTAQAEGVTYTPRPTCTCKNLTSLQQDYQNALYLEGYMRRLSAELADIEARQEGLNRNDPTHRDAGRLVRAVSSAANDAYEAANQRLPFPKVEGYTGPTVVDMIPPACKQADELLQGLAKGSPCQAMAEAALIHEATHSALCHAMGPGVYWDRPLSALKREEAEMYRAQAAYLLTEIKRVLEASRVTLSTRLAPTVSVPGAMTASYLMTLQSDDIGRAGGGNPWRMTGKATHRASITSVTIAGMNCQPGGSVTADLEVGFTTNGLTFELDVQGTTTGGQLSIKCPGGGGGGSMPGGDPWTGRIASAAPVQAGDFKVPNDWIGDMRAMMAGGGAHVTGTADVTVSITCEAP